MKSKSDISSIVRSPATVTVLIIICVVVLVSLLTVLRESLTPPEMPHIDATSADSAVERRVTQIAANFTCTCGACGKESLDICACDTAVKSRGTIRALLLEGKSEGDVIEVFGRTVGGAKPF